MKKEDVLLRSREENKKVMNCKEAINQIRGLWILYYFYNFTCICHFN